jgi:hypothetical protein
MVVCYEPIVAFCGFLIHYVCSVMIQGVVFLVFEKLSSPSSLLKAFTAPLYVQGVQIIPLLSILLL